MIQAIKSIESTIRIYAYFYDTNGAAADPDTSFNIQIKDASGTTVLSSASMSKERTGVYFYDWDLTNVEQGYYIAQFTAVDAGATYEGSEDIYVLSEALVAGNGSKPAIIHLTEDNTGVPLQGVLVWLTTDEVGNDVISNKIRTNSFGYATFYVDPGDYYVWTDKSSGYVQKITVS